MIRTASTPLAFLGIRRRRLAAAAIAVSASGCRPSGAASDSTTTTTMSSSSDGPTSSSSSGSAAAEGWPERWYGQYYEATYVDWNYEEVEIELGVPTASYQPGDYFHNVQLEPDLVRVDYFDSTGDEERIGSSTMVPEVLATGLLILPPEGQDYSEWPPVSIGRGTVAIRPGSDCSELKLEMSFTATPETVLTTLRRGRICLAVPCDPNDGMQCTVTVEQCADNPIPETCDPM
jgi:hypothetical protein